jgi:hypothetical protein
MTQLCISLSLKFNNIGDDGIKALISKGALANCIVLNLHSNKIGDDGMKAFSAAISSGALPALEKVALLGNPGDDAPVLKALADR